MAIILKFSPTEALIECGAIHDILEIFKEAIIKSFVEKSFFARSAKEYEVAVNNTFAHIRVVGLMLAHPQQQNANFLSREISMIIDELNLSDWLFLSGVTNTPTLGDAEFNFENLRPRLINATLLDKLGCADEKVPEEFCGQISRVIMDDPVYINGAPEIKYDSKSLRFWLFQQSELIDPYRRISISCRDIISDHALKVKIDGFVHTAIEAQLLKKKRLFELTTKYNLSNTSDEQLAKGLRRASAQNDYDDVAYLISLVPDVNIQDGNPLNRKTALHWAIMRGSKESISLLVAAGARSDIPDAAGKTARNYAEESGDADLLSLLDGALERSASSGLKAGSARRV